MRRQLWKEYMLSNDGKNRYILPLRSYIWGDIFRAYINKWDYFYATFGMIKESTEISVDDNIVNKDKTTVKEFYAKYLDENMLNLIFNEDINNIQ